MSNRFALVLFLQTQTFTQSIQKLLSTIHTSALPWALDLRGHTQSSLIKQTERLTGGHHKPLGCQLTLTIENNPQNPISLSMAGDHQCMIQTQEHLLMSVRFPGWHADDPDQTILKSLMPLFYPLFDLLEPTFGRCISEVEEGEWYSQNQDSGIWMGDLISLHSPFFVFHQKLWMQLQEQLPGLSRGLVSVTALSQVVVVADRDLKDPSFPEDSEQQHLHREALYRVSRFIRFGGLDAQS